MRMKSRSSNVCASAWKRVAGENDVVQPVLIEIGNLRVGERPLVRPHMPKDGGLQAAEAEIEIAFQLRRVPVRVRQPRRRQRDGPIVSVFRQAIDHRTAGVAEAENLRHLVVRLARRIVQCPRNQFV